MVVVTNIIDCYVIVVGCLQLHKVKQYKKLGGLPEAPALGTASPGASLAVAELTSGDDIRSTNRSADGEAVTLTAGVNSSYAILLGTAIVEVVNRCGYSNNVRALCDNGSQVNLITESTVQRLRLTREKSAISLSGIGGNAALSTRGVVNIKIRPSFESEFEIDVQMLVVTKITSEMPATRLERGQWSHIEELNPLADVNFHLPQPVEVLLGAEIWASILEDSV